jgi:hypothetical protein
MSSKVLNLVIDSQDPSSGPAWFFEMTYDKVVILPPNTFPPSANSKRREEERHNDRDQGQPVGGFTGRKNVLQPGDKPWFCYWNGTLLETFIYVSTSISDTNLLSNTHPGKQDQQRRRPGFNFDDCFVCPHVNK